jgi:hypothetical protein
MNGQDQTRDICKINVCFCFDFLVIPGGYWMGITRKLMTEGIIFHFIFQNRSVCSIFQNASQIFTLCLHDIHVHENSLLGAFKKKLNSNF